MSMGCDRNGEGRDGCGRPTCGKCYPYSPQAQWANPLVRAVDRMSETVKQAHDLFEKWPQLRDVSLNAVVAELAAAEERGRRSGLEERDELLRDAKATLDQVWIRLDADWYWAKELRKLWLRIEAALAPRDSALEPLARAVADEQGVNFDDDQPRDSGKEDPSDKHGGTFPDNTFAED